MDVPAGHDGAHAQGEDRESGGTGGGRQWIGFRWQLDERKGILVPHTRPLHDY